MAMRVVHVAQCVSGGVGAYLDEIAVYQSEALGRENVHFIVPDGGEVHLPSVAPSQIIPFATRGRNPWHLLRFGLTAARAIAALRPAVVHLHSTFAGGVMRPLLMASRTKPKIVYCPHGWAFGMETTNWRKFLYAELERGLSIRTDLIITNSDAESRLAKHYCMEPRRLVTIKNGISLQEPSSLPEKALPEGPIRAAFIGRHDRQKGLDLLLAAIERIPPDKMHLHVVGKGVRQSDCVVKQGHTNITAHGWLSRREIVDLLGHMDVVVMPSRWEAFGLVAIEAMRSGVAVVASDRGALPEIIRDGLDGHIVSIDDLDALASLLASLDRAELRAMGCAARLHYEAEFTSDRMNDELMRAYTALLDEKEAGARHAPILVGRLHPTSYGHGDAA